MNIFKKWKKFFGRFLVFSFLVHSLPSLAQFEMGDEPGFRGGMVGGTLWQGSLPTGSSSNPGRPGMFKLMWNSKLTRVDMMGKVQANAGIAKAGAEVWKSYDVEKRV